MVDVAIVTVSETVAVGLAAAATGCSRRMEAVVVAVVVVILARGSLARLARHLQRMFVVQRLIRE